jgi:uncharacterized coiled-coil DUF342 family protein
MKNTKSKVSGNNATVALAEINQQIEALKQKRIQLAEPLKSRFGELRGELMGIETQIRELDSNWAPPSLKPKTEERIQELISANGPQTEAEIVKALGATFTKWKLKQTLQKKFKADLEGRFSPIE